MGILTQAKLSRAIQQAALMLPSERDRPGRGAPGRVYRDFSVSQDERRRELGRVYRAFQTRGEALPAHGYGRAFRTIWASADLEGAPRPLVLMFRELGARQARLATEDTVIH